MDESTSLTFLVRVTRRLFILLVSVLAIVTLVAILGPPRFSAPAVLFATGVIGGFVGLQRRLKDLTAADLRLISESWIYTCLSPTVGGVLALLLYVLFLSELLAGQLFPKFVPDSSATSIEGFATIFGQHAETYKEYAKLLFWSFLAGYSEHFVTDAMSRFEGDAIRGLQNRAL